MGFLVAQPLNTSADAATHAHSTGFIHVFVIVFTADPFAAAFGCMLKVVI
jgi:hypothetical protein